MALGRRKEKQVDLFIPTTQLAQGPGHPFYSKLNEVLASAGFDGFVEELCQPHYKQGGTGPVFRPGFTSACCSSATSKVSTASEALLGAALTVWGCAHSWVLD